MTAAQAVQAYLRRTAERHRDVVRVPGFSCTIDPHDDTPLLNHAVPDGTPGDPAAIRPVYRERGRHPRIELVAEADPALEARVAAAGFALELRTPLMTATPETLVAAGLPPGVALEPVGDVRAMRDVQRIAFGDHRPVTDEEVARFDAPALLARVDGEPAGAVQMTDPEDGLSEIVGVAVAERFRRRGIATALTAAMAREAFARGAATAFLSPGDAAAGRVYARAGFTPALTAVAYADRRAGSGS